MPKKGSSILKLNRLFALHKLFRTMKSFSGAELVYELAQQGYAVNERLVALDIQELRQLGAEIPGHRYVKYCYKKPFTLLEALEGVESGNFNEVLAYLRQYTASSVPRDQLDKLLIHFEQMVRNPSLEENPYIQYEKVELRNIEKLDKFYRYIVENRVIDIEYKVFGRESIGRTIIPTLLKEYNNRWTLIAYDLEKMAYQNFPLDRILNERFSSSPISGESKFDANDHFKDVIGVSVPQDVAKEKIHIKLNKPRGYYVNTKPWHHSQKLLDDSEDFMVFELTIKPNLEFWAKTMEHIEDIDILSPSYLREAFSLKIKKVFERLL